jgi:UDP-N-acetylglucosamine 3-dehydrogenase
MSNLKVAVIGCGSRGRNHMKLISGFPDVDLVAICDPVQAALDTCGEEFSFGRKYLDLDDLLNSEDLDAVITAPPAHLNAQVALPVLKRGIYTLLEKPPGLKSSETRELRDAAKESGALAMVGWDRRFNPFILEAREMVEARGQVTQLVGEFHKSIHQLDRSGRFPDHLMDNMLFETPIHALDTLRAIANSDVAEVHSVVRRATSSYKDIHAALILFENGCVAQLTANYTTDARLERYEIHGNEISVYLEGIREGVAYHDGDRHELKGEGPYGTMAQDRHFLDCVRDNKPIELPAANLDEAVKTMELAEKIMEGLRE